MIWRSKVIGAFHGCPSGLQELTSTRASAGSMHFLAYSVIHLAHRGVNASNSRTAACSVFRSCLKLYIQHTCSGFIDVHVPKLKLSGLISFKQLDPHDQSSLMLSYEAPRKNGLHVSHRSPSQASIVGLCLGR